MKSLHKITYVVCALASACIVSCISFTDELDLKKGVSLDMQLGAGGLSIPMGSLDTIFVDSLIKVSEGSVLDTMGNGYGLHVSADFKEVKLDIDPVELNIGPIDIDPLMASFDNPTPDSFVLAEKTSTTNIGIASVTLDDVNAKLPLLKSAYSTPDITVPGLGISLPVSKEVEIETQSVSCKVEYDLPEGVNSINRIWFGETKGDGQTITLNVDFGGAFEILENPEIGITALNVTFPSNFRIALDTNLYQYVGEEYVSATDNTLTIAMNGEKVAGLSKQNHILPVTFLVMSADFSDFNTGKIDFDDQLTYSLGVSVDGVANLTETKNFKIGVSVETKLQLADLEASTAAKTVTVPSDNISSLCKVQGLDGVKSVERIDFNPASSHLYIALSDIDITPFSMSSSSTVTLGFPAEFSFENSCLTTGGEQVGEWNGQNLTVSLAQAMGKTIDLHVNSIDASGYEIDSDKCMLMPYTVSYSGTGGIDAEESVSLSQIRNLGDRSFSVAVSGIFDINTAVVVTDVITADISTASEFSIDEETDASLVALKRVDIDPADIEIGLKVSGLPGSVDDLSMSGINVKFPSFVFVGYTGQDNRISVADDGHTLVLDGALKPEELSSAGNGFRISGLRVERLEFNEALEISGGHLLIDNDSISVSGSMKLGNNVISSAELTDISVTPSVTVGTIRVNSITGKVNPAIDPVHETVTLTMDDGMEFLQNGNNSLSLSDPRIVISLDSKVTVPMVLDLSLSSYDNDGKAIAENVTPDEGLIRIPACDPSAQSRHITLVLRKNPVAAAAGDSTVYVTFSKLDNLLERIPGSVTFDLKASADTTVDHFVDLNRALGVSGSYEVIVPLSFDKFHFEYTDTIADLASSLEEFSDMLKDMTLGVKGQLYSTVPFGIKVSGQALDTNGRAISGVSISPFEIAPGRTPAQSDALELEISADGDGLKKLDAIAFSLICDMDDKTESASLEKGQYVVLRNLTLEIPGGLDVDLSDLGGK